MSKRTIGILSTHYLPHLGGVERYVYNMAKQLVANGHRVIIITSQLQETKAFECCEKIEIYRLPCYEVMNGRMPIVRINSDFRRSVKKIEKINFDFFIINTRLYLLSAWGAYFSNKKKIPTILIEHGTSHMDLNNHILNWFGEIYEHMLTAYIKAKCKNYYGVSLQCTKWIEHFGVKAEGVLYNAVCVEDYITNNGSFKKNKGIPQDAIIISFVGRLIKEKGILKLIEAFNKIDNKGKMIFLVIAGDGDLIEEINLRKNDRIIVLGKINHSEVVELLCDTDIYSLPTDYPEGFPTSLLEAAMCECCIVATTVGGTRELLVDESLGCVLNYNSVEEIKEVLQYLVDNEEEIKKKAIQVRNKVRNEYTWDRTVEVLEKTMEELILWKK